MSVDERLRKQLVRQEGWYGESWRYLIRQRVLPGYLGRRPRSLDVGCGPGLVMRSLQDLVEVEGLDHDKDMVDACLAQDLRATLGKAEDLPFEDSCFDAVYCSFLLVWTEDPEAVLREMLRVSKGWVLCLAEPDYGARVDYPVELRRLTDLIIEGTRRAGGEPRMGRRLRSLFSELGVEAEVGVHSGMWGLGRLRQESPSEWEWIEGMVGDAAEEGELQALRRIWDEALRQGSLVQYNPTFYALARKPSNIGGSD